MNEEEKYGNNGFGGYRTNGIETFEFAETQDGHIVAVSDSKIVEL